VLAKDPLEPHVLLFELLVLKTKGGIVLNFGELFLVSTIPRKDDLNQSGPDSPRWEQADSLCWAWWQIQVDTTVEGLVVGDNGELEDDDGVLFRPK
jgi:hypothetical protein